MNSGAGGDGKDVELHNQIEILCGAGEWCIHATRDLERYLLLAGVWMKGQREASSKALPGALNVLETCQSGFVERPANREQADITDFAQEFTRLGFAAWRLLEEIGEELIDFLKGPRSMGLFDL